MLIHRIRDYVAPGTFGMMAGAWVLAAALALAGACAPSGAAQAADSGAPPSAVHAVTDTYHGVQVSDPYRWLEKSADPKVHAWSVAQDKRTRQYLDALPQRAPIYRQLLAQISATSSS